MTNHSVTQREIAAHCQVSVATVSLALRGHPRISQEQRERVKAVAKELGYQLDPALAHWARQRWRQRPAAPLIGVISQRSNMATLISRGARQMAKQLGYRLERFDMGDPIRLAQRLKDAGIRGLIVEAHNDKSWYKDFPFQDFIAVAMGLGAVRPPLDVVKSAVFQNMELLIDNIMQAKRRRIAFINTVHPMSMNERMQYGALSVAASAGQFTLLPIFNDHTETDEQRDDSLVEYMRSHKPDCVIGKISHAQSLKQAGFDIPRALSVLLVSVDKEAIWSGLDPQFEQVGVRAMQLLDQHVAQHRYGIAEIPVTVEVPGIWWDGKSLS